MARRDAWLFGAGWVVVGLGLLGGAGAALSWPAMAQDSPDKRDNPDKSGWLNQAPADARAAPRKLPGARGGGEIVLPNQWSLKPAGSQVKLGDFPVNLAVHPKAEFVAALHAGYGEHEIVVVNTKTNKVVSRATVPQAFYGLAFSPAGDRVYCSGGEFEVVHQFDFADGYLGKHKELRIAEAKSKHVPAGLAVSAAGDTLYAASAWGGFLTTVPLARPEAVEHLSLGADSYPYAIAPFADGKRLAVSLWGQAAVAVIDLEQKKAASTWSVLPHPTEMAFSPDEALLYVACANTNSVVVLETAGGRQLEVISSALYPKASLGSTPNSLALSADGKALLVANADNNNVAVIDVSERGKSRSLGFVPVGWYPTSARFLPDGRLCVANGKGLMSTANPRGPNPLADPPATVREYIGGLFRGTLSLIPPPGPAGMAKHTRDAFACSPLRADEAPTGQSRSADNPIPAKVGDPSPIKYCVYIIKENRTYDQVFGDLPQGNGDPHLCIFPEKVTPNHHALARRFVLLDNFYVESEVSADGHQWTTAAYATDFTEKTWPLLYRGGLGKLKYPSEGNIEISHPSSGYIWDRCKEAGVGYFSFGEYVRNGAKPGDPSVAAVPALEGHFDSGFRGYDLDYPDVKRAERFIAEYRRFEKEGRTPRFIMLRLPNDHTYGTMPGKHTPTAMVADNDLALGMVIEALSHSALWKETAVFVIQDDAQNGSDHVDAHRTVALVCGPHVKPGSVDSNMYSTASMLRTMELILGLKPMSQFDAAALPMYASFQASTTLAPYKHLPANVDLNARNPDNAFGADISRKLDFSKEDAADDLLLNEVVWRSVRGADSPMPAPVRAAFVLQHREEDDDED